MTFFRENRGLEIVLVTNIFLFANLRGLAWAFLETHSTIRPALLGPLPGIMGALQALEVLRLLGGMGPALLGRVLIFKGHQFKFMEKIIRANPQCPVCSA